MPPDESPGPAAAPMTAFPSVPMRGLDTVWFQVSGSVCNLACTHCFISCSPSNRTHAMMDAASVEAYLEESERLGVREFYFTGGEPFLNPELVPILAAALRRGPATVLTNGTLITARRAGELRAIADGSRYSLEIRLSLDGCDAASNDRIRGPGTFERILEAIGNLAAAGLNPIITVTEACEEALGAAGRAGLLERLRGLGLARPRLKVMPLLLLGAETERTRGYREEETLAGTVLAESDADALQCASGRMVTAGGVYVCPILIDSPLARMGRTLAETLRPFPLSHRACHTCHTRGLNCRT
ncbi:MAG TPA: radical SAM protein [Fibrobacteria bacterium]|nr:radical SAM protein [Fibrobacteria bacterium]